MIVLASSSATRAKLLRAAGLDFRISPSGFDEADVKRLWLAEGAGPREIALRLAEAKASAAPAPQDAIVIGADTTLDLGGRLLDKPANLAAAHAALTALRGREHTLHTGVALVRRGQVIWRVCESARLRVREFSDEFLDAYLERMGETALASVGCYELEGLGAQLFDEVEGDFFSILGLPLLPLLSELRRLGAIGR